MTRGCSLVTEFRVVRSAGDGMLTEAEVVAAVGAEVRAGVRGYLSLGGPEAHGRLLDVRHETTGGDLKGARTLLNAGRGDLWNDKGDKGDDEIGSQCVFFWKGFGFGVGWGRDWGWLE